MIQKEQKQEEGKKETSRKRQDIKNDKNHLPISCQLSSYLVRYFSYLHNVSLFSTFGRFFSRLDSNLHGFSTCLHRLFSVMSFLYFLIDVTHDFVSFFSNFDTLFFRCTGHNCLYIFFCFYDNSMVISGLPLFFLLLFLNHINFSAGFAHALQVTLQIPILLFIFCIDAVSTRMIRKFLVNLF